MPPKMNNDPKMNHGRKRTLLDSFRDAFRGVWYCLKSERNMRFHLVACCYVLFFASRLSLTRGEMAALALTIGAVLSAETMNTAIERLCDFAQRQRNPFIRSVKDMAAGAVLLCALAAVIVGLCVLCRPELWQAFTELCSGPVSLGLFLLSLVIAFVFVFVGPQRVEDFFSRGRQRKE